MTTFSERLRRLRQAAGLSQVQLAGDDLSPSYISLLESGKRQPSDDVAGLLAERLGCAVEDLLTPAGEERRKQAQLSLELSRVALANGDHVQARTRLEDLVADPSLDRALRDEAVFELTLAHEGCLDLEKAVEILLPLYERAVAGQSHLPLPSVATRLSYMHREAGDLAAAIRVGEDAVRLLRSRRENGTREYFRLVATLAGTYLNVGDVSLARGYIAQALELAQQYADPQGEAALAWNGAVVAEQEGRLDEALLLSRQALAILKAGAAGDLDAVRLQWTVAWLLLRHEPGHVAEATALLEDARTVLPRFDAVERAVWASARALAHLLEGDAVAAETMAAEALVPLAAYPSSQQAETLLVLGDALSAQGRTAEALERYTVLVGVLEGLPPNRAIAMLWREVSDRFARFGRFEEAIDGYRNALTAVHVRSTEAEVALAIETAKHRAAELAGLAEGTNGSAVVTDQG